MSNAYDFKAWLETKDPNQEYHFMDCQGNCLMGQYMASKGQRWDMDVYADHIIDVLGGNGWLLQEMPQTFGGALDRVKKVLEDA
jgi:hypothetical protein